MYSEVKQYCLNNKNLLDYANKHFKTNQKIPIINFIIKNRYHNLVNLNIKNLKNIIKKLDVNIVIDIFTDICNYSTKENFKFLYEIYFNNLDITDKNFFRQLNGKDRYNFDRYNLFFNSKH